VCEEMDAMPLDYWIFEEVKKESKKSEIIYFE